jgi:pimeloyl-ACP methyl ester carboxylesterase
MTSRISGILVALTLAAGAIGARAQAQDAVASRSHSGIAFRPCADNPAFECGTLRLPVDYERPHGETFDLAVIRVKATGPRIGVHFVHPGGNGSGIDFVLAGAGAPVFQEVRKRFDIVSIDPRGAGRTRPLHCRFDLPQEPTSASDQALIAYLDEFGRRIAEQCLDEDRDFVLSINGINFARDIDTVRAALGERQLTMTMISNSGPVGALYANLFPRRVRALVLDSPVGPDFKDFSFHRFVDQTSGHETTLHRLDQLCRQDARCRLAAEGVVAVYEALLEQLAHAPVVSPGGQTLDDTGLREIAVTALGSEFLAPPFVNAMADARTGDFSVLFQFLAIAGSPEPDDSFVARFCNDYGTRRAAADYLPFASADFATHPHAFRQLELPQSAALCSAWPAAKSPVIEKVDRRLEVPIVIVGGEFDPAAPFSWTQRMAQALGADARVIRYRGAGHGLSPRGLPCVGDVLMAYWSDLMAPEDGLSCQAVPVVFGAASATRRSTVSDAWVAPPGTRLAGPGRRR